MAAIAEPLKKIFDKICNSHINNDLLTSKEHFSRHYKLTFEGVVFKILHSFRDSVEFNLATFLPQLNLPVVTAGAFSIARYKLKIDLFHDLNKELNQLIATFPIKLWKGYRLVAGDGTTVNLPVHKSTIEHFGLFRDSKQGGKTVMANACMLYDVLSNYVLASNISPFKVGEKTILRQLVEGTDLRDSIIILDRGFSSFYILKIFTDNNLGFCLRLNTSNSLFADMVLANGQDDFIADWAPSEVERSTCRRKHLGVAPIKVRVTKIPLPNGENEIIISSLTDVDMFKKSDIKELYLLRWGIEEGYKKLKPKMKLEQFGCKRQEGIYQEFYSHIFMMNLTHILCNEAQKEIETKTKGRKYKYKYNWMNAYKFIQYSFVSFFKSTDIESVMKNIINQIEQSIIAIVDGRRFIRTTASIKKHRFSPMYK